MNNGIKMTVPNFADSDEGHILLKWGGVIIKCKDR